MDSTVLSQIRSPHAARKRAHSTPSQFLDLLAYIRLHDCRKLIGEVGDRQHEIEELREWKGKT
jgi:hypothetical protein